VVHGNLALTRTPDPRDPGAVLRHVQATGTAEVRGAGRGREAPLLERCDDGFCRSWSRARCRLYVLRAVRFGLLGSAKAMNSMGFCEHCEGQRFDRARVLRALRASRKTVRKHSRADEALRAAIKVIRALEIPHLEPLHETSEEPLVH
jgi:hypothetical protein